MNFEEEKVVYVQPVCEDNTERIKEIEQYENEKEVEKRRANSSIIDIAKEFEESNKKIIKSL